MWIIIYTWKCQSLMHWIVYNFTKPKQYVITKSMGWKKDQIQMWGISLLSTTPKTSLLSTTLSGRTCKEIGSLSDILHLNSIFTLSLWFCYICLDVENCTSSWIIVSTWFEIVFSKLCLIFSLIVPLCIYYFLHQEYFDFPNCLLRRREECELDL